MRTKVLLLSLGACAPMSVIAGWKEPTYSDAYKHRCLYELREFQRTLPFVFTLDLMDDKFADFDPSVTDCLAVYCEPILTLVRHAQLYGSVFAKDARTIVRKSAELLTEAAHIDRCTLEQRKDLAELKGDLESFLSRTDDAWWPALIATLRDSIAQLRTIGPDSRCVVSIRPSRLELFLPESGWKYRACGLIGGGAKAEWTPKFISILQNLLFEFRGVSLDDQRELADKANALMDWYDVVPAGEREGKFLKAAKELVTWKVSRWSPPGVEVTECHRQLMVGIMMTFRADPRKAPFLLAYLVETLDMPFECTEDFNLLLGGVNMDLSNLVESAVAPQGNPLRLSKKDSEDIEESLAREGSRIYHSGYYNRAGRPVSPEWGPPEDSDHPPWSMSPIDE